MCMFVLNIDVEMLGFGFCKLCYCVGSRNKKVDVVRGSIVLGVREFSWIYILIVSL